MDSKAVDKELRKSIRPLLKEAGFDRFTQRVAWRHGEDAIDVIEFRSVGAYDAEMLGTSSFSFSASLGKFLLYVPPKWPPKVVDGVQLPKEPECIFRGAIMPTVSPCKKDGRVWSVDREGRNVAWCIRDLEAQLPSAMRWFERLDDRAEALRILLEEGEDMHGLWGFGRKASPLRAYHAGYIALALGDMPRAKAQLQEAVDSKCFVNLFTSVEGALHRAA